MNNNNNNNKSQNNKSTGNGQSKSARRRANRKSSRQGQVITQTKTIIQRDAPVTSGFGLPPSSFQVSQGSRKDSVIIRGRDYMGSLKTGSIVTVGTSLRVDFLSPQSATFSNTRLQRFSTMYEKYLFRKFKIVYIPIVPTSSYGAIGMAFDKDYADSTPSDGEDGLRQYMAFQNATSTPVWQKAEINPTLTDMQDFYYCNDTGYDGRLVYQGQVYFFIMGSPASSSTLGQLFIEYEVEMFDPQLENPVDYLTLGASSPTVSGSTAQAWNNLFLGLQGFGKIVRDVAGNQGVELPPGTYILEQATQSAGVSTKFTEPAWTAVVGTAVAAFSLLIDSAISTSGTYNSRRVTITGGPVRLWGNAAAGTAITNAMIRIIQTVSNAVA